MNSFYGGRYLVAHRGRVALHCSNARHDWLPSHFSIVSSGTERWQLSQSAVSDGVVPLGYIAVHMFSSGEVAIAPAPHGSTYSLAMPGTMIATAPIEMLAIGRFQLMAAASIQAAGLEFRPDRTTILIGSGAVSLGAALELGRRGFTDVRMVSSSASRLGKRIFDLPWLRSYPSTTMSLCDQVIDCVGTVASLQVADRLCRARGTIGLLGSPRENCGLSLYRLHRDGVRVVGLHELLLDNAKRAGLFSEILTWLIDLDKGIHLKVFLRFHSSRKASEVYDLLANRQLPEPLQIFDWSS
jgi:hypothetical protein